MIYYTFNEKRIFITRPKSLEKLKNEIIEDEFIELKDDEILNCYTENNKLIENEEDYKNFVPSTSTLFIKIEKKKNGDIINKDNENIYKNNEDEKNQNQNQNFSSNENSDINKISKIILEDLKNQKNEICKSITEKMNKLIDEKIIIYFTKFENEQNEYKTIYNEINQTLKNIVNKVNEIQDNNNNKIINSLNNISNLFPVIVKKITLMQNFLIGEINSKYNDIVKNINNNKANDDNNLSSFNSSLRKIETQIENNKNNEKNLQKIISEIKSLKDNNNQFNNNNKQFNNILTVLKYNMNDLKTIISNIKFIPDNINKNIDKHEEKNNKENKEKEIPYKATLKILNKKNIYKFKDISENKEIIKIEIKNKGNIKIPGNFYIKTINDNYYIPKKAISNTIKPNSSFVFEYTILCKNLNNPSPQENLKIVFCDGDENEICSTNLLMNVEFEDNSINFSQLNFDFNSNTDRKKNNEYNDLNISKHTAKKIKTLQDFFDGKTIKQLKDAIQENDGDVDKAIQFLIEENS